MNDDMTKKPNPKVLGTGAASKAGSAVVEHQIKTKSRIDKMLGLTAKPGSNNKR